MSNSTASPLTLSVAMLFSMVPAGIIFPFGGLVADKFNRKLIMVCADGMIGVEVSAYCLKPIRTLDS